MKSRILRILIVLFWLVMTAWLIRYEAFPHLFANSFSGYKTLYAEGPVILDSWMKITFNDRAIGYSHTLMDLNETDPNERYLMYNQTVLRMNIMGEMQQIGVRANAALDVLYRLQSFSFSMSAESHLVEIQGLREQGQEFRVTMKSPAGRQQMTMEIPDEVILHAPMTEWMMNDLKPGKEIHLKTLDPSTLSMADVTVRAVRPETITVGGEAMDVTLLMTEYQGLEVKSWVDEDGHVVRQETPFGWIMEVCSPEEAMAFRSEADGQEDMLRSMSVPVEGVMEDPRSCSRLVLELSELNLPAEELRTARQQAVRTGEGKVKVTSIRQVMPDPDELPEKTDMGIYLKPSAFIQSTHPDIIKKAEEITKGSANDVESAIRLNDWAWKKIYKDSASSLPSALDVLHTMRGDCNEHTYIYVALARAVGIPAKVCIGLVYLNDGFYYHAWPAVYLGEWIELDPTFGQRNVDATHIYLLEGEFATQLKLLGVLGQVKARILEQENVPVE